MGRLATDKIWVHGMSALPPPLNLDWDDLGSRTLVLLPDRLTDEPVLEAVTEQVVRLVDELQRHRLLLIFTRVSYLTSGPIRLLLALRKRLSESGGELILKNLNAPSREVLDVTKVLPLFQTVEDCPVNAPPVPEQEAAFRRAIAESPADVGPRLMFADWLQERNDPLGEFIRLQCLLEDLPPDDPRRTPLASQASALLQQYEPRWLGRACHYLTGSEFRRGFPEVVVLDALQFLDHAKELVQQFPVRHLKLLGAARVIDALAQCPHLTRLTDLQFTGNYLNDAAIEVLVRCRYLDKLQGLHLPHNRISDAGLSAIANAPALTNLTLLDLSHNLIRDDGVAALANSPHLARLTTLKLNHNRISAAGARALVESRYLGRLTLLDLSELPPGYGTPYPEERNIIPPPEQRALRNRFGENACRF